MLKRIFSGVVIVLALLGANNTAVAGPYEDGSAAYLKGDYATAIRHWRIAAEQGDAYAQIYLGIMYGGGSGAPLDYVLAQLWFNLARAQGEESAVKKRDFIAGWMSPDQVAEAQGDATAQHNLGLMYDNGNGVPQDFVEAAKWYRLAADQGFATAQSILGFMYGAGLGVPQDFVLEPF